MKNNELELTGYLSEDAKSYPRATYATLAIKDDKSNLPIYINVTIFNAYNDQRLVKGAKIILKGRLGNQKNKKTELTEIYVICETFEIVDEKTNKPIEKFGTNLNDLDIKNFLIEEPWEEEK